MHEVPAHAIEVRGADQLGPAVLELGVYLLDRGQQFFAAAGKGYRPPRTPAGRRSTPGPAPCESAHKAFPRKRRPLTASGSDGTTHKIGTCLRPRRGSAGRRERGRSSV